MPRGVSVKKRETATETLMKEYVGGVALDKVASSARLEPSDVRTPEGLLLLQCWVRDGMTGVDIAKRLHVKHETLSKWRERYPEIDAAFKRGKELVDYEVENALLKAALGYTKTKTITYIGRLAKNGNRDVGSERIVEEVGPNVTACLAWLNNRNSKKWQRNRDDSLTLDENMQGVTINIIKGDTVTPVEPESNKSDPEAEENSDWGDE